MFFQYFRDVVPLFLLTLFLTINMLSYLCSIEHSVSKVRSQAAWNSMGTGQSCCPQAEFLLCFREDSALLLRLSNSYCHGLLLQASDKIKLTKGCVPNRVTRIYPVISLSHGSRNDQPKIKVLLDEISFSLP